MYYRIPFLWVACLFVTGPAAWPPIFITGILVAYMLKSERLSI